MNKLYEAGKKYARVALVAAALISPSVCERGCAMNYGSKPQVAADTGKNNSQAKSLDERIE